MLVVHFWTPLFFLWYITFNLILLLSYLLSLVHYLSYGTKSGGHSDTSSGFRPFRESAKAVWQSLKRI